MKKNKKILLSIISAFALLSIPTSIFLSSCSSNNTSQVPPSNTDPENPDQGETPNEKPQPDKPSNPDPNPTPNPEQPVPPINPPTSPSPKPPVTPTPPTATDPITNYSLSITNKSSLLPSQLINVNNNVINSSMLTKNFDTKKITNVSYKLISLSDKNGTISIEMSYTFNNNVKKRIFNFDNLLKINANSISLFFKKNPENNEKIWNAYKLSQQQINDNEKVSQFFEQVKTDKLGEVQLLSSGIPIPISYLNVSSITIKNFNSSTFFTSNKKQNITFELNKPTIKYYEVNNQRRATSNNINFPTNKSKNFIVQFYSASDFLLNQITSNNTYRDDKFADYYWGDQKYNNSSEIQTKLSDNFWLQNYKNNLDGNTFNTQYQVSLLNNNNSLTNFDHFGNFDISLRMKINNNTNESYSETIKTIRVTNCINYPNDLFSYSSNNNSHRFSFKQDETKLDSNLNSLKRHKQSILNEINNHSNDSNIQITNLRSEVIGSLSQSWKNNTKISFNNEELIQNNTSNYYQNDYIYISSFYMDDFELWYNRTQDVFQIKFNATISMSNDYESNQKITINITKSNQSLENLKK